MIYLPQIKFEELLEAPWYRLETTLSFHTQAALEQYKLLMQVLEFAQPRPDLN